MRYETLLNTPLKGSLVISTNCVLCVVLYQLSYLANWELVLLWIWSRALTGQLRFKWLYDLFIYSLSYCNILAQSMLHLSCLLTLWNHVKFYNFFIFINNNCQLAMKVTADKHMDVLKIGTLEWLEELTSQVTKQMLTHCESAHQQHHLLAILARTMFGRNFLCKGM